MPLIKPQVNIFHLFGGGHNYEQILVSHVLLHLQPNPDQGFSAPAESE
jgi:hypothetical protein